MDGNEFIKSIEERINKALNKKRNNETNKLILEVLQVILFYIKDDHPKTEKMYRFFVPASYIFITALTAVIGLVLSGKIQINFIP